MRRSCLGMLQFLRLTPIYISHPYHNMFQVFKLLSSFLLSFTSKRFSCCFGRLCIGAQAKVTVAVSGFKNNLSPTPTSPYIVPSTKCVLSNGLVVFPYVAFIGFTAVISACLVYLALRCRHRMLLRPNIYSSSATKSHQTNIWISLVWIAILLGLLVQLFAPLSSTFRDLREMQSGGLVPYLHKRMPPSMFRYTPKALVGCIRGFCVSAQVEVTIDISGWSPPKIIIPGTPTSVFIAPPPTKCILPNGLPSFPYNAAMAYAVILCALLLYTLRAKGFASQSIPGKTELNTRPHILASLTIPRPRITIWLLFLMIVIPALARDFLHILPAASRHIIAGLDPPLSSSP
ncbi:hypothetical protein FB451DRAFT_60124 [Mycena latifolia]|nr:hypothetical protein FB451DRAFT_60124 [Mycena latifolia]